MKKNNLRNWKIVNSYGLAQIPLLIGLLIMAVAVPVATKLVEQNQDTRNLATSSCASAGELMYYGHPCCSGLVQTNCTGSGSYATCTCINPIVNPPTSTPYMKTCTYRTCSNNACVSRTTTIPSNLTCPASTCLSDSVCRPANTSTPRPTSRPTTVPTARPTDVPECGGLNQKCCFDVSTYQSYCGYQLTCKSGNCVTSTITSTPKPTATPKPISACKTDGCNTLGSTASCTVNPGYAGVTPGVGTKTCNRNWIANCLNWSECKVSINPTRTPTGTATCTYSNVGKCGSAGGCPTGQMCYTSGNGTYCKVDTDCGDGYPTVRPSATRTPKPTDKPSICDYPVVGQCGSSGGCADGEMCYSSGGTPSCVKNSNCNCTYDKVGQCGSAGGCPVGQMCYTSGNGTYCKIDTVCSKITPGVTGAVISKPPINITKPPISVTGGAVATKPPVASKCKVCANGKKAKGDANCDGKIDVNDRTIWSTDFRTDGGNRVSKNTWNADFNCDGFVDVNDRTIWSSNFTI